MSVACKSSRKRTFTVQVIFEVNNFMIRYHGIYFNFKIKRTNQNKMILNHIIQVHLKWGADAAPLTC